MALFRFRVVLEKLRVATNVVGRSFMCYGLMGARRHVQACCKVGFRSTDGRFQLFMSELRGPRCGSS